MMSLAQLDEGGVRRPSEAVVADCPGRKLPAYAFAHEEQEEAEDQAWRRRKRFYRRVSSSVDMAVIVPDENREAIERLSDIGMDE